MINNIEYATISEIMECFDKGTLTSRELVLFYLKRISEIDQCAGGLHSVLEINSDALCIADELDLLRKSGKSKGMLHGIPVFLKDNINTKDKLHTSAGSLALAENYANYDAFIVEKLRNAGAIILGKTNMTEFANYMTQGMRSGYSSRGGQVLNAHNAEASPSGSSSGSAVAVAANLCTVSVGTETAGSIISPAQVNGVVGLKPTIGLVRENGIIPISNTLDTAGPIAKNVYDTAVLLSVLAGHDSCGITTDYTKCLHVNALSGKRIGINRAQFDTTCDVEKFAANDMIDMLKNNGAIVIENIDFEKSDKLSPIMKYEFKSSINYYLSTLGGNSKIKTLHDIIVYNQNYAEKTLQYGQSVLHTCENNTSGNLTEPEYLEALIHRENAIHMLNKLFDENHLDVIICAAGYSNIAPFTGFPSMTIPIGKYANNVPIGCYFMARKFDEENLLSVLYAMENSMKHRL